MSAGLSGGLPFRLLGGILLLMALLDVPVAVTAATGGEVGALVLFGVIADAGLLAWRRRG
jgi:Cu/Ag efflux pump CusA